MKHCIDCKFSRVGGKYSDPDPERAPNCTHPLAKRGEPSMVMKIQQYLTCYEMRKTGACGLDAKLYQEKSRIMYDE